MSKDEIRRSADFSLRRDYRYALSRGWGLGSSYVMFIGLNPSTADETLDDPTIRRCIGFAKDWGYDGLVMTNLFAFRATKPKDMMNAIDPVGAYNNVWLQKYAKNAGVIVAAWGNNGSFVNRDVEVRAMFPQLHYLRLTKAGHPEHPLYLPKYLRPTLWTPKAA